MFFSRRMQPASWRYYVFFSKTASSVRISLNFWVVRFCCATDILQFAEGICVFFVKFAELPCQGWCRKLHDFQVLVDFKTSDHFFLHGGTFSNLYSIHDCITSPVLISKRFIDKNTGVATARKISKEEKIRNSKFENSYWSAFRPRTNQH